MLVNDDESRAIRSRMNQEDAEREEREREEARKNKDFVQLYRNQIKNLRRLTHKDPSAAEIFLFLTEHMGKTNALICSYKVFEEALDLSKSTVYRAIKTLREGNYIEMHKVGNATVYHLNADIVWSSWATGKRYAALKGNVLLAESEQDSLNQTETSKDMVPVISIDKGQDKK